MYPIEIKKNNYKFSIIDKIDDILDFIIAVIGNFRSPRTVIMFLEKSFHF